MKKVWLGILCVVLLGCTQDFLQGSELEVPKLKGRVNDYANVLTSEEISQLENKLEAFETQTTNQVVILLIPSLKNEVLEEFSMKVCEKWKLGRKDQDNGCLLFFVIKDGKSRIDVGYGLEPILTDGICGRILRNDIAPSFKEKKYFEGLDKAISSIISYQNDPEELQQILEKEAQNQNATIAFIILAIVGSIIGFIFGFGELRGSIASGCIGASVSPIIWGIIFGLTTNSFILLLILGAIGGFICYWVAYIALIAIAEGGSSSGGGGGFGGFSGGGGRFGGGGASGRF